METLDFCVKFLIIVLTLEVLAITICLSARCCIWILEGKKHETR